ncbi:olfactory receptor 2C3-like [Alosa sapidissima]|uniref:olfactory receptor 2C3-like n=1 Tax=Alosa sapidissima TaxID=34773 RepID=UPI001C098755|nr:olfactory receptor 2C3-like [Alosa sapidissima]
MTPSPHAQVIAISRDPDLITIRWMAGRLLTWSLFRKSVLIYTPRSTLIFIVTVDKSLHEPMYIFISNLCANGLYGTVGFYPKILLDLRSDIHMISYSWCMIQTYVIYSSALCEMSVLTVMSYDRYVAICRPLQYHSILTPHAVLKLLVLAWACPLLAKAIGILLTSKVPICGSYIYKLFCDNPSILKLGCYRVIANQVWSMMAIAVYLVQLVFILISSANIIHVCISISDGRKKFSKTCVPHIVVMVIYIMTALFDVFYSWDGSVNLPIGVRNALAIQFLILPPLLNPIIYGLQLPQIRKYSLLLDTQTLKQVTKRLVKTPTEEIIAGNITRSLTRDILKVISSEVRQQGRFHSDYLVELSLTQQVLRDADTGYKHILGYIQHLQIDPLGVHLYSETGLQILAAHLQENQEKFTNSFSPGCNWRRSRKNPPTEQKARKTESQETPGSPVQPPVPDEDDCSSSCSADTNCKDKKIQQLWSETHGELVVAVMKSADKKATCVVRQANLLSLQPHQWLTG